MKTRNLSIAPVCLAIIVALAIFPTPSPAQLSSLLRLDINGIQWSRLLYEVKSTSVDVTTEVRLEASPPSEAQAAMIKSLQGDPLPVPADGCYKITVDTLIDSMFQPPVQSSDQLWFDPQDASALGRERLRRGADDFKKVYRFTKQGVYRRQKEPAGRQELSQPPDQWTKTVDTFYAYDLAKLGCRNIVDRLLMIYVASASGLLDGGQPLSMCVFGKRQLFQVTLRPGGVHSLKIDYTEANGRTETRRQGEVKAVRIDLEAKPLESDLEKVENFSFMGFLDKISFLLDPASGLPIEMRGEIPPAGIVTLKLKEARYRKGSG